MSVLVPVLERVMNWNSAEIRRFFGSYGLTLLEWDRMRTDILTIQDSAVQVATLSDDNATFDLARLRQLAMSGTSADRLIGASLVRLRITGRRTNCSAERDDDFS